MKLRSLLILDRYHHCSGSSGSSDNSKESISVSISIISSGSSGISSTSSNDNTMTYLAGHTGWNKAGSYILSIVILDDSCAVGSGGGDGDTLLLELNRSNADAAVGDDNTIPIIIQNNDDNDDDMWLLLSSLSLLFSISIDSCNSWSIKLDRSYINSSLSVSVSVS